MRMARYRRSNRTLARPPERFEIRGMADLVCVECGALSDDGRGWRAEIADDPRDDEPAEVALYCPACARREFGCGLFPHAASD
jgi:hypothetical protein